MLPFSPVEKVRQTKAALVPKEIGNLSRQSEGKI
jgi:hypothetical protein